tara:strand:+ start:435 stop:782 length:348 start_codon:yes stop_codon:yes gene_type:complete
MFEIIKLLQIYDYQLKKGQTFDDGEHEVYNFKYSKNYSKQNKFIKLTKHLFRKYRVNSLFSKFIKKKKLKIDKGSITLEEKEKLPPRCASPFSIKALNVSCLRVRAFFVKMLVFI